VIARDRARSTYHEVVRGHSICDPVDDGQRNIQD
jgi:hypothetical protein